jgi:glycosyltransferase involved in cell wall biosynthesis
MSSLRRLYEKIHENTMNKSLISVVVPAYNLPEYTEKTIDSIMLQSYRPIEIIISDDNSPNSLKDLVNEKKAEFDSEMNIKYFRQKENLNHYWNLQFAIGEATGEYLVLLDHDDWLIDCNFFCDSIKAIEDQPNCFMSIANSIYENSPETVFNLNYSSWHYVDGAAFMRDYLYTSIHPYKSSVMLNFDKLKQLDYEHYFINKESANIMKIIPDEAFVLICLLASEGSIALTGRVVGVHGMPPISLGRTALWNKNRGQEMFIQHFLLHQYFEKIGCNPAAQSMRHNLVLRYPCKSINLEILKYLNFKKTAIVFMVLGVLRLNLSLIISFPRKILVMLRATIMHGVSLIIKSL